MGDAPELRDVQEQVDLQREAILKLVELVSALEGVDASALITYADRIQHFRPSAGRSGPDDAKAAEPAAASEPNLPSQEQGALPAADDRTQGLSESSTAG